MNQQSLEDLLANQSFVRWVKGEGSFGEKEHWDSWLRKDPEHQLLMEEAKELITAFGDEYKTLDPLAELEKLDGAIEQYEDRRKQIQFKRYEPLY